MQQQRERERKRENLVTSIKRKEIENKAAISLFFFFFYYYFCLVNPSRSFSRLCLFLLPDGQSATHLIIISQYLNNACIIQRHLNKQFKLQNSVDIVKRMEEVRLMESRKSLRLMDQHDVDFARLAEGVVVGLTAASVNGQQHPDNNITAAQFNNQHHQISVGNPPRKRCSSASTSGIDVPGAFFG